jgi:hypothetical protein
VKDFRKRVLVHRGGNKHRVFDAENMSGCYRKPVEDFRKRVLVEEMAYKLKTEIGQAIYRLRKCTVEPVIGIIKEVLGFRQFSLRGLAAAAGEWCLVCLAFNLKRWHILQTA